MRVWPGALRSAASAPPSAGSRRRTSPPRSWVHSESAIQTPGIWCVCFLSQVSEPLTSGRRAVAGTVSGTTGDVAEGGTEPRTETAAASTAGGGRDKTSGTLTSFSWETKFQFPLLCLYV